MQAKVTIDENQINRTSVTTSNGVDFETAIAGSRFGRFNVLLLLAACPAIISAVFETTVISYILPSAECDLKLSLIDKGILNAVTYSGMILSAIIWGYLSDRNGRKNLLIYGYLADFVCALGSATSQSIIQLMIFKFLGGSISCGPFAILMTYLGEFHGHEYRSRILFVCGIMFSLANICLPFLAVIILSNNWNILIFNLSYHSWHVFLAVCSLPSIIGGLLLSLFPESPRFLMSKGKHEEALRVFRIMYSLNTKQPQDKYPFKKLIDENNVKTDDAVINEPSTTVTKDRPKQSLKAMFHKPYLQLSLQVYLLGFCILFGQNTMRLWLPQLFASFYEYEQSYGHVTGICSILEFNVNKTNTITHSNTESNSVSGSDCTVINSTVTYYNNIVIAVVSLISFIIASSIINIVGPKLMQGFALFCAGCCTIALYWSSSSLSTLVITAILSSMTSIASTSNLSYAINLFPTYLRTIIVSINLMIGRMGSIVGNILFPVFMSIGCIPPLLMIAFTMFIGCILSALLPNTKKIALK